MCGIVGMVTRLHNGFTRADTILFQQALIVDALRGLDSTGMFSVNTAGDIDCIKVASHPFRLLQNKEAAEFMTEAIWKGKVLVGHNRKATTGKVINENAHPFQEEHIVLVHNGMVYNADSVAKEAGVEVEVDSHIIAHILAKEENVVEALKKLRGAFAVVWYDQRKNSLNLVRNNDRPLFIAEHNNLTIFGSEAKMLDWLLDRNGISNYKIEPVPVETVISFSLADNERSTTSASFRGIDYSPFQGTQSTTGSRVSTSTIEPTAPPLNGRLIKTNDIRSFYMTLMEERTVNGENRYFVYGKAPTGELCRAWLPVGAPREYLESLQTATLLLGNVSQVTYRNGVLQLIWLENIKPYVPKKESTIRTFNGVVLSSQTEWEKICSDHKCKVCKGNLDPAFPKYTTLSLEKNGMDVKNAICPACLATRFNNWSVQEQNWILSNNGYDPRSFWEERKQLNDEAVNKVQPVSTDAVDYQTVH